MDIFHAFYTETTLCVQSFYMYTCVVLCYNRFKCMPSGVIIVLAFYLLEYMKYKMIDTVSGEINFQFLLYPLVLKGLLSYKIRPTYGCFLSPWKANRKSL